MTAYRGRVQYEVTLKRASSIPTANPVDNGRTPGKFLDLSFYLLIRIGAPNDIQRPHFRIPETMTSVVGVVTVRLEVTFELCPLSF